MTLLTRISRLFRADFHALLDSLEEPDVLLRQALREMEEEMLRDEQCEKRWATDLERLAGRRCELGKSLVAIAEELDVCLEADREPLARSLIKRRLETERLLARLSHQSQELEKALIDLRTRLKDQRQRLEELRQKAALFDEECQTGVEGSDSRAQEISVGEDEIEIALLREKQRRMSL